MGIFLIISFIIGMTIWGFLSFLSLIFSGDKKKNQKDIEKKRIEVVSKNTEEVKYSKRMFNIPSFFRYDFFEAVELSIGKKYISGALLQRCLLLGYYSSDTLLEELQEVGVISKDEDENKNYKVLISNISELTVLLEKFDEQKQQAFIERRELERKLKIQQEKELEIRQHILKQQEQKELRKKVRQSLIDEGLIPNIINKRKSIPSKVKDAVWNRDGGRCVECGSNRNLEFDHIIPHSKGGADTVRNLQLLCESCNRKKSNKIG